MDHKVKKFIIVGSVGIFLWGVVKKYYIDPLITVTHTHSAQLPAKTLPRPPGERSALPAQSSQSTSGPSPVRVLCI